MLLGGTHLETGTAAADSGSRLSTIKRRQIDHFLLGRLVDVPQPMSKQGNDHGRSSPTGTGRVPEETSLVNRLRRSYLIMSGNKRVFITRHRQGSLHKLVSFSRYWSWSGSAIVPNGRVADKFHNHRYTRIFLILGSCNQKGTGRVLRLLIAG